MSEIGDWLREQAAVFDGIPNATGAVVCWNFGDKFDFGCVRKDGSKEQAEDLLEGLSEAVTEKYGE